MDFDWRPRPSYEPEPEQPQQEQSTWHMDPSVSALFDGVQSTDEELGTADKDIAAQAESCLVGFNGFFNEFRATSKVADNIALGETSGLGQVKKTPDITDKLCQIAAFGAKMLWEHFGGAAEMEAVFGILKEEVLGPAEKYAETAYDKIKEHIEKHQTEFSLKNCILEIVTAVNDATDELCDKASRRIASMPKESLASTWRLISGTRNDMTVHGDKLDTEGKQTVTTEMFSLLTGIEVGGKAAEELANTIRQQALLNYAGMLNTVGERNEAYKRAASGEILRTTPDIEKDLHEDNWIHEDEAKRARVRED
jgi:hypothetical protein